MKWRLFAATAVPSVRNVLEIVGGLAIVAALLVVNGLALYVLWWIVMIVVSAVPLSSKIRNRDE